MQKLLPSFVSRTFLSLSLLALATGFAEAQTPVTVTIGTGTSAGSTNVLLSTSTTTNKYARTVSIYSAAELQAAGARAGSIPSGPGTRTAPASTLPATRSCASTSSARLPRPSLPTR